MVNIGIKSQKQKIIEILKGEGNDIAQRMARRLPFSYIPTFNLFGLESLNINGGAENLFTIPHTDYYFELYFRGELITTIALPYNPSTLSIDTMQSVRLTHTSDTVFREAGLSRARMISLTGKSGFSTRLGYARDGGYCFENGEVLMHEFDEFLKGYHYLLSITSSNTYLERANFSSKINQTQKQRITGLNNLRYYKSENDKNNPDTEGFVLVFRCVKENISLKVEVNSFNYSKNVASQRFGYDYSLTLNSYGIWGPGRRSNLYLDAIDAAAGYVNKASAALALLEAMNVNLANNYISPVNKIIQSSNQLLDQFSKTIESASVVSGAVFEVANNTVNLLQRLDNTVFTTNSDKNILTSAAATVGDDFKTQLRSVKDSANVDKNAKAESRKRAQKNQLPVIETVDAELNVRENDKSIDAKNIEIVRNMLKNVDYDLANDDDNKIELGILTTTLNTLRYQVEGIKSIIPKDYIAINRDVDDFLNFGENPSLGSENQNFIPLRLRENESLKDIAIRIYGNPEDFITLMTFNGWMDAYTKGDGSHAVAGDIIKIPSNEIKYNFINNVFYTDLYSDINDVSFDTFKNDINLIDRIDNLNQGIVNTLLTYQGEIENDATLGLANILGIKNIEFVKKYIENILLRDERIKNVEIKDITQVKDQLYVSFNCVAIDGNILNFNTSLDL